MFSYNQISYYVPYSTCRGILQRSFSLFWYQIQLFFSYFLFQLLPWKLKKVNNIIYFIFSNIWKKLYMVQTWNWEKLVTVKLILLVMTQVQMMHMMLYVMWAVSFKLVIGIMIIMECGSLTGMMTILFPFDALSTIEDQGLSSLPMKNHLVNYFYILFPQKSFELIIGMTSLYSLYFLDNPADFTEGQEKDGWNLYFFSNLS